MSILGDKIRELRKEKGLNQTELSNSLNEKFGLQTDRVMISKWETGFQTPVMNTIKYLANYFNVTIDYLNGETDEKNKPLVNNDGELTDYLEELKNRKEMRMLFSVSKGCTKEEVEQAVRIIEALRKNGDD